MNADFGIYQDLSITAESLEQLGLLELAKRVLKEKDCRKLKQYLAIIEKEAAAQKRTDVLEMLQMAGLIY